ncbi:MAG: TonB-dependent receptor [Candidatus Krumholzibacteria bacterium]|nr:TonB-dependent receptor [Candidatus Krumholzibacteria bacterium]
MVDLRKWLSLAAILALTLSLTGIAVAQSEKPAKDEGLEEVVVTAQKKEQALRDVPSSVATLSDEKLDVITSGGQDIRMLSSRVPSLHIESSFGRTLPRFYIRGLGNTDFDLNASQPVSLVYDGVVLENPILKGYPIFDMERVEVLRGPQGTLFGRNTPAGIVKFESRKPTFENEGYARFSYGTYNTMQFEGAVGGEVNEGLFATRASFLYQKRSDWVTNTHTSEENSLGGYTDFAGRMQFLLTPGDKFTALLNVHMRDLDGTARLFRANIVESGSNEIRDGFKRDEVAYDGANEQTVNERGGVLTMDYHMDNLTLTSVTGLESANIFSRGDIDGGWGADFLGSSGPGVIPFPSESADGIPKLQQLTQEFRLASNYDGKLNFQTGIFIFDEDLDIDTFNYDTLGGGVKNGFAHQSQQTKATALFGTLEYQLTEKFKASGGMRYSDETKDFMAERTLTMPLGVHPTGQNLAPITDSRDSDFVSWDINGMFNVNPDVNVYGRVARGFRAPSFQGRVLFGDEVTVGETEKILSYEIGTKANLGQKARANLSVFSYIMNDQQLTAVGGTSNFTRLLNAEETAGMGFELELEWLPTSAVLMTFGTGYNKTEIKDPNLGVAPGGAAGLTVLDPETSPGSGIVSIDGNSLPNAPEWVFNVTLRAAKPAGNSGEVFLYTDWAYRSEVSFFLYESTEFTEGSLVEGGLRVGYTTYDGIWELAAFGRNITDNLSRTGGIDFNNLTGFVNEPRTFGMEVRRRF